MTIPEDNSPGGTRPSKAAETTPNEARLLAHRRWIERTGTDPSSEEAWIGRAETASALEEKLMSLNRALAINPANTAARKAMHDRMRELLHRDPRLTYRGESSHFYHVQAAGGFEFGHPKDRRLVDPYPPARVPVAHSAHRWLLWSLVGLLLAGLATVVSAPIAALRAAALLRRPLSRIDERRAQIVIFGAALLWLVGLFLAFILVLHFL
jgi:hypothetical protein